MRAVAVTCQPRVDSSGGQVEASATITVLDPPTRGIVNIELTAATTAALAPGFYTEALRITRAGSTAELQGLLGPIDHRCGSQSVAH